MDMEEVAKGLRVRLPPKLKSEVDRVLKEHKISQVNAVNAIMEWFVGADAGVRVLILGQLQGASAERIAKLVLEDIETKASTPDKAALVQATTQKQIRESKASQGTPKPVH